MSWVLLRRCLIERSTSFLFLFISYMNEALIYYTSQTKSLPSRFLLSRKRNSNQINNNSKLPG